MQLSKALIQKEVHFREQVSLRGQVNFCAVVRETYYKRNTWGQRTDCPVMYTVFWGQRTDCPMMHAVFRGHRTDCPMMFTVFRGQRTDCRMMCIVFREIFLKYIFVT